ncbi:MAG: alpha/beta hydrolase-fold protein [Terriglobia bacterium]
MRRPVQAPVKTGPARRLRIVAAVALTLAFASPGAAEARAAGLRFEVSYLAMAHSQPITGRVFVMISRSDDPEPRLQVGSWGDTPPFFGRDVIGLRPGEAAVIDASAPGYPLHSLSQLPAGDYYVQALINVYTQFHRADGHVIWAHMDHWEGQQFNLSPGNLYSTAERLHLDPGVNRTVKLSLTEAIPAVQTPPDTQWVKRLKIQNDRLSRFWGRPIYLGATVLLPKGYDAHPNVYYPVGYVQGHFDLAAPFGFNTTSHSSDGYKFYQAWNSRHFPRMICVTFQHPTPYFDDSYAVNSANSGPYGDAIMKDLIPYVERHFRAIRRPYARVLTGGSTGGWESLVLQVYHPSFFGGAWSFYPDPVDFRRYDLVNIYSDENAFYEPGHEWLIPERYIMRRANGQPEVTERQFSQLEDALGIHGRSGQQLEAWEAAFGPVGADGYPTPLWDKLSGKLDHRVADYMRDHGYDLRYYLESRWTSIAPDLLGKLHVYVGDMDNYYLNLAVYLLQNYLATTQNPHYAGTFEYGRPIKGHGWQPMSNQELVRMMAQHIIASAPPGADTAAWQYP